VKKFPSKQNFIYLFLIGEVYHNSISVAEHCDPNHGTSLLCRNKSGERLLESVSAARHVSVAE